MNQSVNLVKENHLNDELVEDQNNQQLTTEKVEDKPFPTNEIKVKIYSSYRGGGELF